MITSFDPVVFSLEENAFLHTHVGEPPVVAAKQIPPLVNRQAVLPLLEAVYSYQELEKHEGQKWAGVQTIKNAIEIYLREAEKWKADKRQGAPRFPPLYSFDSRGKFFRSGPGSDSGQVKTYFDSAGQRRPFEVSLLLDQSEDWKAQWIGKGSDTPNEADGLKVDNVLHRIECLVCRHTEKFNAESRASYNAARARMSKHLRKASDEKERHREVHTLAFGSRG